MRTVVTTADARGLFVLGLLLSAALPSADAGVALASSAIDGTVVSSNAEGSELGNLVVNGVAITSAVEPNTRMTLPGVGYVVLNEQILSGDGASSSGITVNMIHVVLQQPILG